MADCPVCGLPAEEQLFGGIAEPLTERLCPEGHATHGPLLPKTGGER